jgi:hypothetical protein
MGHFCTRRAYQTRAARQWRLKRYRCQEATQGQANSSHVACKFGTTETIAGYYGGVPSCPNLGKALILYRLRSSQGTTRRSAEWSCRHRPARLETGHAFFFKLAGKRLPHRGCFPTHLSSGRRLRINIDLVERISLRRVRVPTSRVTLIRQASTELTMRSLHL